MTISAIAIPNLKLAIGSARNGRTVVELHNIADLVVGYAAGNNGLYPNSLADIDCDKLKDPWGNSYQYTNLMTNSSSARLNQFDVKINTYFDLYSVGPDKATAKKLTDESSQDDIIYASDGSYIGLAYIYK